MNRNGHSPKQLSLAALLSLALAACGGGSPDGKATIGPLGGTVTSPSGLRLEVPAGALKQAVELRVVEAPPHRGVARFELEPRGLALAAAAKVSVKHGGAPGTMKLVEVENEVEHALEQEKENEAEHAREAEVHHLGALELRHQAVCDPACGAGLECDDGTCKPHVEHPVACDPACATGFHCDNGVCKADDAGAPASCDPACGAGEHCEQGVCLPDGTGSGGGAAGGGTTGGTPPVNGACPAGWELDATDGTCKPHGGGSGGSGGGHP